MSSIFNNTSTRIFCISGELSDVFCLPNGWIVNFDELLNIRLKAQGFSGVIFCSTQRSLTYAVDRAGVNAMSVLTGKKAEKAAPAPAPAPVQDDDYSWLDEDIPASPAVQPAQDKNEKLIYTHKIAKDQLSAATDCFMRDTSEPKAIVFTSLEDLIKLATTEEGRKLLERFEEWKTLPNENRNICIFLSKTLDSCGLQNMLHDNRVAVLESLFLRKNEFNRNSSISIGAPLNDEIEGLLEHLRIVGHTYTKHGSTKTAHLRFHRSDHSRIVRMLSFCSRDSGFTQLKSMKEILERYMEGRGCEVWLYPDTIAELYPDSSAGIKDDTDPMDILRERRGWEPAYNVINSFISNYRVLYPDGADSARSRELTVDRFEPSSVQTRGAVPNFVLEGPPGVGKTAIANLIGRILQREGIIRSGHTVIGSRDKLVGEYVGSTAIRTAALIEEAQEGVLLVDEVYSIAEQNGDGNNSYCDEVFNTIVAAMTNSNYHFCVIFAGYADRMPEVWKMNEGLFSRFGASNVITLREYEPPLLQSIFESQFGRPEGLSGTVTVLSDDVKNALPVFFENFFSDRDRKNFGNARDINNLVSDVKRAASYRRTCGDTGGDDSIITVERVDFEARQGLFEKRGFSAEDIYSKLHEYIGMEFLEDMFNDQLALRVECVEKGLPYPGPSHMIWAGNPGTGKSTAAQLTAELYHSLGILGSAEPIYVDASELTSVYVSGSASKMNEKIDEACRKNAVLIIEEAYQLLEKGGEDAIHAMLNRMETDRANFNLILILYKDKVQDFLDKNPGLASRLKVYEFPDYDAEQLYEIFLLMCRKSQDEVSDGCKAAAKEYIDRMYLAGGTSQGNARLIRQLTDLMKQRRYNRILARIAEEKYGADTAENRKKAAAARAMGTVKVPEGAYIFTENDLPEYGEV